MHTSTPLAWYAPETAHVDGHPFLLSCRLAIKKALLFTWLAMAQTTGTHVVQMRDDLLSRLRLRLSVPFQHRDAQFEIRWLARLNA